MDASDQIRTAFSDRRIEWRRHALERLMQRGFTRSDVLRTVSSGEIIESDLSRRPFPTYLWFAIVGGRPIHLVIAWDQETRTAHVITVYEPDDKYFESDFKTRRDR